MHDDASTIWFADVPETPAVRPKLMSFSSFMAMEECPRRWSFSRASYPTIWEEYGYPPNPTMASLIGQIVHRSIERIIKMIVSSDIVSLDDATFIQAMRDLAGC